MAENELFVNLVHLILGPLKNFVAIFLIACMVGPFWGSYLFLSYTKYQIRKEIKYKVLHGLEKDRLISFTFDLSEMEKVDWEDDHEFEFGDRMYDVIDISQSGNTITILCFPDDQETSITLGIDKLIAAALGRDPASKNQEERILTFLKINFMVPEFVWEPSTVDSDKLLISHVTILKPQDSPQTNWHHHRLGRRRFLQLDDKADYFFYIGR